MSKLILQKSNELPKGWTICKIEDLALAINSGFPSGKHNKSAMGVPHIRPMNIDWHGNIDLSELKFVEIDSYDSLKKGDILFNNTNSPKLLGKTTYIRNDTNWAYSNHMTRIRVNKSLVNPAWIAYYLHRLLWEGFYKVRCRNHVNQASINSTYLSRHVPIMLAPYEEQKRIVAKIEELFSKLDFSKQILKKTKILLKQYLQSLLKSAFEGKLTEKWRNEHLNKLESGSEILKTIATYKKTQESLEITSLPNLPKNWAWTNVSMIENFVGSGITPRGGKSVYVEKGIPFIRSQNVFIDGLRLDGIAHVTEEMHKQMTRTHLKDMDVLLNITGASIGRCTYVPNGFGHGNVNQHVCIIRTCPDVFSPYLSYWLNSPFAQTMIFGAQKGETREGLNYSQIRSLIFPLCSLLEQNMIVQQLEKSLTDISNTDKEVEHRLYDIELLRQSILKYAFEGKLVPQDPNDEPVESLLQKISQEKERLPKNQTIIKTKQFKSKRTKNAK